MLRLPPIAMHLYCVGKMQKKKMPTKNIKLHSLNEKDECTRPHHITSMKVCRWRGIYQHLCDLQCFFSSLFLSLLFVLMLWWIIAKIVKNSTQFSCCVYRLVCTNSFGWIGDGAFILQNDLEICSLFVDLVTY